MNEGWRFVEIVTFWFLFLCFLTSWKLHVKVRLGFIFNKSDSYVWLKWTCAPCHKICSSCIVNDFLWTRGGLYWCSFGTAFLPAGQGIRAPGRTRCGLLAPEVAPEFRGTWFVLQGQLGNWLSSVICSSTWEIKLAWGESCLLWRPCLTVETFVLGQEFLGKPGAAHLLNWIMGREISFTLNVLWDLDGAREPSWASSFPPSVVVELMWCDLMNPSEVFKESITRSGPLPVGDFQVRAWSHSLYLSESSSSACHPVASWYSLPLIAVSLPSSLPSADMPWIGTLPTDGAEEDLGDLWRGLGLFPPRFSSPVHWGELPALRPPAAPRGSGHLREELGSGHFALSGQVAIWDLPQSPANQLFSRQLHSRQPGPAQRSDLINAPVVPWAQPPSGQNLTDSLSRGWHSDVETGGQEGRTQLSKGGRGGNGSCSRGGNRDS